jgi:hypothetical protein
LIKYDWTRYKLAKDSIALDALTAINDILGNKERVISLLLPQVVVGCGRFAKANLLQYRGFAALAKLTYWV